MLAPNTDAPTIRWHELFPSESFFFKAPDNYLPNPNIYRNQYDLPWAEAQSASRILYWVCTRLSRIVYQRIALLRSIRAMDKRYQEMLRDEADTMYARFYLHMPEALSSLEDEVELLTVQEGPIATAYQLLVAWIQIETDEFLLTSFCDFLDWTRNRGATSAAYQYVKYFNTMEFWDSLPEAKKYDPSF